MKRTAWLPLTLIALAAMGVGCFKDTAYVPAEETRPVDVAPSIEGSRASTGGQATTVTPPLATEKLVAAVPRAPKGWTASETRESKNPVPLPDGTRTEYTAIIREYQRTSDGARITATLADTRGLPALTTFLESYETRNTDTGYRAHIPVGDARGWMTYTYGANRDADGIGSFVMLYRDRFLIQLDGSQGVSSEDIATLAETFDLTELN